MAGHVEDSLNVWAAKRANFDLHCGVDVQFLCGAGLDPTKKFLTQQSLTDARAREALEYLEECVGTGDFEHFTVEEFARGWMEYFSGESGESSEGA